MYRNSVAANQAFESTNFLKDREIIGIIDDAVVGEGVLFVKTLYNSRMKPNVKILAKHGI